MDAALFDRIKNTTALRKSREENKDFIIANQHHLDSLIKFAFNASDDDSYKACWILEFIAYQKPEWLQPHVEFICSNLKVLTDESAIRPIAKVCQLLVTLHYNKSGVVLSERCLAQITEACFDWLITDVKVAPKAYSIRTLYVLGIHFDWIFPELKIILAKDYAHQSAGYKAAAKEILKKMP